MDNVIFAFFIHIYLILFAYYDNLTVGTDNGKCGSCNWKISLAIQVK